MGITEPTPGRTVTEYHERWTAGKELAEKFRYKTKESNRVTERECDANVIAILDHEYIAKRAGAKSAAQEKFLADAFLLGADICQSGGMMTQLRNFYAKGKHTYP